jgi:hypothetical protein
MAELRVNMSVSSTARLERVARRLREAAEGGMQRELTKAVVGEAPAALAKTKAAFLGVQMTTVPSRGGGGSTGLRARVAAATHATPIARGARFEVNGAEVGRSGNTLARGVNGVPWRHPTFGHTGPNSWVRQSGEEVFEKTLRGHPGWVPRLERALDTVARQIEG